MESKTYSRYKILSDELKRLGIEGSTLINVLKIVHNHVDSMSGYRYAWLSNHAEIQIGRLEQEIKEEEYKHDIQDDTEE